MATVSEVVPDLTRERALALYRGMVVIRRTEEALARAHAGGLVLGACHTYVGEEAVATGVSAHLRPDDPVLGAHRGHGHALAKGVPPRELMAELFGRVTGSPTAGVEACTSSRPRSVSSARAGSSAPASSWQPEPGTVPASSEPTG